MQIAGGSVAKHYRCANNVKRGTCWGGVLCTDCTLGRNVSRRQPCRHLKEQESRWWPPGRLSQLDPLRCPRVHRSPLLSETGREGQGSRAASIRAIACGSWSIALSAVARSKSRYS